MITGRQCFRTLFARCCLGTVFLLFFFYVSPQLTFAAENAHGIVLVRGTSSTPDAAERQCAARVTERIGTWLKECGVGYRVVDDEAVENGDGLKGVRIALFCYNPHLPQRELHQVKRFIAKGGKLIVFYSSDKHLATAMRLKLGSYARASAKRNWYSFVFATDTVPHVPERIFQTSRNIRPVHPRGRGSKTIAFWQNSFGRNLPDAAVVQTVFGYWITHILLDSDAANKKLMLLALLGKMEPAVWRSAAAKYLTLAGRIGPFDSVAEAVRGIRSRADSEGRKARAAGLLSLAERLHGQVKVFAMARKHQDVVVKIVALNHALERAYAAAVGPRRGEFLGVWEHSGAGLFHGDWPRTCKILSDYGVDAVFPNFVGAGVAHYASKLLPRSKLFSQYGDQMAQCLKEARKHGLKVHVWKTCWRVDAAPKSFIQALEKEERLQVAANGNKVKWLCPSNPRNRQLELAVVKEITSRNVDGIHLDYNRYPDGNTCYCEGCRMRFEMWYGRKVAKWPEGVRTKTLRAKYAAWRCEQTERLSADVSRLARAKNPKIKISAAVFGRYPLCIKSIGQDWASWLRKGYVDFVCPMNYTADPAVFTSLLRTQLAIPHAKGNVFPGIGVVANESLLTPAQVVQQILLSRKEGAKGYMMFQLSTALHRETLPVMRLGPRSPISVR